MPYVEESGGHEEAEMQRYLRKKGLLPGSMVIPLLYKAYSMVVCAYPFESKLIGQCQSGAAPQDLRIGYLIQGSGMQQRRRGADLGSELPQLAVQRQQGPAGLC